MPKEKNYKRRGGFILQYKVFLESAAYRDLRPPARCLLEEFQLIFLPSRNGQLSICTRTASERLNVSEPTAIKAFKDLVSHGFIILKNHHIWTQRKAREWALTFEPVDGREPTDEWKVWDPDKPYPVAGRKKSSTKKIGAELLKKRGQTAKKTRAMSVLPQKPQNTPLYKSKSYQVP